ncbi:Lnb N-terminal periplasmic domain-containing protein [Brevundimonas sp.]|uniref:Lnb N-terminal periplasmic domain-containing protein n=1 Tax=Brevundimonas sp. TaxID=1871086 RepID=UPI002FC6D45B
MTSSTVKARAAGTKWAWGSLLVALPLVAWTALAVHYQLRPFGVWVYAIPLVMLALQVWVSFMGRGRAWAVLAIIVALVALGWAQVRPLQNRDWAPELSRGVVADIQGSTVHLSNVRDFRWHTRDDGDPRWIDQTVNLDQLKTVDFISTVWASPHIAHTMVSFGFADGQYVVFSAEIRREKHEKFSEIGGFFKQFELVLIGATEEDIVKLRTHARGEDVSIFPLTMTPEQKKALFLSYVGLGNELAVKPRFYQTITTNCTTVIWRLARTVEKRLPMDWRILLSGHTQDYLYDLGVIKNDRPLPDIKAKAHVTEKARSLAPDAPYSQSIRQDLT